MRRRSAVSEIVSYLASEPGVCQSDKAAATTLVITCYVAAAVTWGGGLCLEKQPGQIPWRGV